MQHAFKAASLSLAIALAATPALSDQTENIVSEQRTSISVRIKPDAAQAFMPAGWTANATNGGVGLTLIFMDRSLQLTPDGRPLQSGANRLLVLSMSGKNNATGEVKGLIVGGYSTDPLGVPGAYKVYKSGAVTVTRTETGEAKDGKIATTVHEHWIAKGTDGASVDLDLSFTRGLPTFGASEQKVWSGADPTFNRTYKVQQASETLRGGNVDHVQSVKLKATGGPLGKAVDGTEQITAISNAPFYSRLTFVP